MTIKATTRVQQNEPAVYGEILLHDYVQKTEPTDQLSQGNLSSILMGLFGEVGSIMATAKKHIREDKAYAGYQQAVEEEFGDTFWYFTALCRRLGTNVDTIFSEITSQDYYRKCIAASAAPGSTVSYVSSVDKLPTLDKTLLNLGEATAALFGITSLNEQQVRDLLSTFSDCYLQALQVKSLNFSKILHMNIEKTCGRFLEPDVAGLPIFDSKFSNEEKIPWDFEIKIAQRNSGQCHLQWNGVFIGDPLMDNIPDPDGYRFHDVLHFAHAAILHWSPTFRGLIKQKRKSDPKIDEAEDGGRAIIVEEGLTAWIFSRAKQLNFFEGHDSISFDLLKTVKQFVQGYEVEKCPLKLWEQAILKGYEVFRQVRDNNGGVVVGNREARTIEYKAID